MRMAFMSGVPGCGGTDSNKLLPNYASKIPTEADILHSIYKLKCHWRTGKRIFRRKLAVKLGDLSRSM